MTGSVKRTACLPALCLALGLIGGLPGGVTAQQVDFECQLLGPFPAIGTAGDCEGVTATNLRPTTGVINANPCGFPSFGVQFAQMDTAGDSAGSWNPPFGGPITRPLPAFVEEIRVPIPAGTTDLAVCFDFYNAEGASASYNDGLDISVVDAAGNLIASVAYRDTSSVAAPGGCIVNTFSYETGVDGPEGGSASFLPTPAGAYVSIACWNGADDVADSTAVVDNILFGTSTPVCPFTPPTVPVNDDHAGALSAIVVNGTNPGLNNIAATNSGVVSAFGCFNNDSDDVWFAYTAIQNCTINIDTLFGTTLDTVLTVYDANGYNQTAGSLVELACNDDATVGTIWYSQSLVTVPVTIGDLIFIQVATSFAGAEGTFDLNINGVYSLSISSPSGPGSLDISTDCGPPGALYVVAVDLVGNNFGNGWFYGLDIPLMGLIAEINAGPPFLGNLDAAGSSNWAIPGGLPPGLTFYSVSVALGPNGVPQVVSNLASHTL